MFEMIAKPFGLLLMWLYELVANYGVAVILFALVVKVILLPFQMKSKRGTMKSARLQPQMAEIQKKHGANKQKYNEEIQKLYKEEGVNPASGCIWGILPLPILLALYYAIRQPLTTMMGVGADLIADGGAIFNKLASLGFEPSVSSAYLQIEQTQFISRPENFQFFAEISDKLRQIDYSFLKVIDLGAVPSYKVWDSTIFNWSGGASAWGPQVALVAIALISGGLSLAQSLILKKINPQPAPTGDAAGAAGSMKMMTYLMPLMSVWFAFMMPAALGIYWASSTVLQIVQEIVLTKRYNKILDAEEAVKNRDRSARDAEIERKRLETEQLKSENRTEVNKSTSRKKLEAAEKQEREAKSAEWEKKNAPPKAEVDEPSRAGSRQYARGRAYVPDRFGETDSTTDIESHDIESQDAISDIEPEVTEMLVIEESVPQESSPSEFVDVEFTEANEPAEAEQAEDAKEAEAND